jgi:citrate lyase beta subunit
MLIETLEAERGLPPNSVHLSLAIETVEGLNNVAALGVAHPRVTDIGGPAGGDFTVDLGIVLDPALDQLDWARGELDLYVRSRGARGLGRWAPGQAITEYGDEEATRLAAEQHRRDGGRGAGGIHPSLVRPHNAGYTPPAEDLAQAAEVIAAVEGAQARGEAYAVVRGRIATPRVAEAARDYLQYAAACRLADERKAAMIASVARDTEGRA